MRATCVFVTVISIMVLSSSASAQIAGSSQGLPIEPFLALILCSVLIVSYFLQIAVVYAKNRSLVASDRRYAESQPRNLLDPVPWTFLLCTFALPLGVSFISRVFPLDSVMDESQGTPLLWALLAYRFSIAVFIIMITLEVSYIYNIVREEWDRILIGALTIDIVSFFFYSLMGEPTAADGYDKLGPLPPIFLFVTGLVSFLSSFLTLYRARQYEAYANARHEKSRPVTPPSYAVEHNDLVAQPIATEGEGTDETMR